MRSLRISLLTLAACSMAVAQTSSTAPSQTGTTVPGQAQSNTSARDTGSERLVLPTGTEIEVRVNESLSSETSQQGDRFTGQVNSDVMDRSSGRVLIPKDAQVSGRVLSAIPSGRLSSVGELQLSINTIRVGNSVMNVTVQPFVDKGESHTRSNTTKIGGGAALGAIIGAIAGGGKGAAIGAGVGGAAGAGTAAATGKRPAEVKPEAVLKFVTAAETSVSASAQVPSTTSSQSSSAPNDSTNSQSTTTDTDSTPVLQKRGGSSQATTPPSSTSSTTNATSPTTPSTTASNTTSGANGQNYPNSTAGSTSTGAQANGTGTSAGIGVGSNTSPTPSSSASTTSTPVPGRSFTARDRRVINNCIREHASTLPDSALRKTAGASQTFKAGDSVPTETQRQLRSLPLQCDRELPALSNDLERVIYGGQVMLIDTSNRVLDAFDITP